MSETLAECKDQLSERRIYGNKIRMIDMPEQINSGCAMRLHMGRSKGIRIISGYGLQTVPEITIYIIGEFRGAKEEKQTSGKRQVSRITPGDHPTFSCSPA